MKITLIALACLLTLGSAHAQEKLRAANSSQAVLEARVQKLWAAFKAKDKTALAASLSDNFREFEEDTSEFGDKKTEVNAVDEFELLSYSLSDFTVKSIGPNAAVVTYIARYEGKSGGVVSKGKSVFGEVWIRAGSEWKALYMQETYVK